MTRKFGSYVFLTILAVLGSALSSGSAWAQNFGTLAGHVYDQAGTPLKGVTVTAASPTQIGGSQQDVTNDEGAFRLQGLFPGVFRVTVTAAKLRTLVQENVKVTAANTTDIDLIMEVEAVSEEIKIIQKAPTINQTSGRVGVSYDEEFMNSLPLPSRDYQGVASLTPGVSDSGNGNPKVRGGTYFSNNYTVDGFNTTDPVTRTFGQNFSFSAMANVEVTTSGGGAETAGTTGGTINIVTKSGSNRFEADASLEYTDQNLEFLKRSYDVGTNRFARFNLYLGGPIMKDQLWFAVSTALVNATYTMPHDPNLPDHPSATLLGMDGTLKLTWRLTQRNQIDVLGTVSPAAFDNRRQDALVEAEAESRQFQRAEFMGLTWQYIGEVYLLSRLGYRQVSFDVGPQRCQWDPEGCTQVPAQIDLISGIERENYRLQSLDQRRTIEFSGLTEWARDFRTWGGHVLRLGWRYEAHRNDLRRTVPGDAVFGNVGNDPLIRIQYCSNDPLDAGGNCSRNFLRSSLIGSDALFNLSDSWKPTRYLTFKPGVAFHMGGAQDDKGTEVTNITAFTPHFAALWDPTHDGKTKLQFTFDGIADTGFLALARFTSRSLYSQNCRWDPMTQTYSQDCRSGGGNDSRTVGLPCGPSGVRPDGSSCRTELTTPRVWEATLGGEREIATGVALGLTFIYRKFNNQWEDAETNGNYNEGGTALRRDGRFKTNRSQFIFDLQTPEGAERLYRGATVQLHKREGRMKGLMAYTISRYEGVADSSYATTYLDNPAQASYFYGALPGDNLHDLRIQGSYSITPWLSGGLNPPSTRDFRPDGATTPAAISILRTMSSCACPISASWAYTCRPTSNAC
jgi:hypothetical protein